MLFFFFPSKKKVQCHVNSCCYDYCIGLVDRLSQDFRDMFCNECEMKCVIRGLTFDGTEQCPLCMATLTSCQAFHQSRIILLVKIQEA